jgi:hypothetical protein
MSSPKPTTVKSESTLKQMGRKFASLRERLDRKNGSQTPSSNISQSYHDSETESIHKSPHKLSATVEESISPLVEPKEVAVSSYPVALNAPNTQSRQSLVSHKSKGKPDSNDISPNDE